MKLVNKDFKWILCRFNILSDRGMGNTGGDCKSRGGHRPVHRLADVASRWSGARMSFIARRWLWRAFLTPRILLRRQSG